VALDREIRGDTSCPGFKLDLDRLLALVHTPTPASEGGRTMVRILVPVDVRERLPSTERPPRVRAIPSRAMV
jgi:hypothetical protein